MTLKLRAGRLVASIPHDARRALALDPAEALAQQFDTQVVPVEELRESRGAGGWCDGVSLTTDRVICYAPSPGSRRQNFTLLHELGHILVNENDDALDWLADRPDPDSDQERLCDAIAAEILLPEPTINQILAGAAPTVEHLRQLYAASRASEEVCAIALAARLPVRGAVVLIRRRTATVAFAASNGWPPLPIPRGLAVPARHPLRDLGTRQRWTGWTTADLRLALAEQPATSLPSYRAEDLLQVDAVAGPRRTTAILLDILRADGQIKDHPPKTYATDPEPWSAQPAYACPKCGNNAASANYPCDECGVAPCPACGRCRCF
jgi:Zn-dependent peptidase ImmA (M78 family)